MEDLKKQPSQRQLKVGEELRHILSEMFMRGDFYDHETRKSIEITISEVRMSPDLKNATVYVMPLAGRDKESTLKSLENALPAIRAQVGKKARLRHTPSLYFKLDHTFEQVSEIEEIFNRPEVKRDIHS